MFRQRKAPGMEFLSVSCLFENLMDLEEIENGSCMPELLRVYVVMVRSKERPGSVRGYTS